MRRLRPRLLPPWLLLVTAFSVVPGCALRRGSVHGELSTAAAHDDALVLSDALESLIADGRDTPADREYAFQTIQRHEEDTAAYGFARALITGRLVQQRGLLGAALVPDIERFARRSRELDPSLRNGAATRLLGTLYVIAPAALLTHGDSEQGLDLLEGLTQAQPDVLENHLRLAEAYLALGDPTPAGAHLCRCLDGKAKLRRDDQLLLARLVASARALRCSGPAVAVAP
jgi:hypothetical protein